MEPTKILSGDYGFGVCGHARSTMLQQLGFDFARAMSQSNKQDETPVADRYQSALGDTGLPAPVKLNANDLCEGMAAAFVLLTRHIGRNDPEKGRKPEYLRKRLIGPEEVAKTQIEWRYNNDKLNIEAAAAMYGADPTARLKVVKAEIEAYYKGQVEPFETEFVKCLGTFKDWEESDLIDTALEAMVNTGRDPLGEFKKAAQVLRDIQKKRFEAGGYVSVDPGIFALLQA